MASEPNGPAVAGGFGDEPLVRELLGRCAFPAPGSTVVLAVSGGRDSTAMAVLAAASGLRCEVVHVDHGLRAGSEREADVVRQLAELLGATFRSERVHLEGGANLEARARDARAAVLPPGALIGHTADDQAETMLLQLLRGAALPGLAGIRPDRRPILRLRRRETHELCRRLALPVVHDPSNDDPQFWRNRVRHEVLPLLDDIAGRDVTELLARQARYLRADDDLLERLAAQLDPTDAAALEAAPVPLAMRALREWLRAASPDGQPPSSGALERVMAVVRHEAVAAELRGGVRVQRSRNRLSWSRPGESGPATTDL